MILKKILEKIKSMQTEIIANANGTAVKFADGTMICTLNITVIDQAIDTKYGDTALYYKTREWTFPASFIEKPAVTCSMFKWGTSGSWGGVYGINNSNATLIGYDFYSRAAGTSVNISAIAVGRWK